MTVKGRRRQATRDDRDQPQARHDYEILETYEAGLVLRGTEVKSLREGQVDLQGRLRHHRTRRGVAASAATSPPTATAPTPTTIRTATRKLLLHRREIARLLGKVAERGLTIVPLRLYFKEGRAKLELGLARGKKLHDKRAPIRERDVNARDGQGRPERGSGRERLSAVHKGATGFDGDQ